MLFMKDMGLVLMVAVLQMRTTVICLDRLDTRRYTRERYMIHFLAQYIREECERVR